MSVISTTEVLNNITFRKTYSDQGFFLHKINTEEIYDVAYDVLGTEYTYEETENKIEEAEGYQESLDTRLNETQDRVTNTETRLDTQEQTTNEDMVLAITELYEMFLT